MSLQPQPLTAPASSAARAIVELLAAIARRKLEAAQKPLEGPQAAQQPPTATPTAHKPPQCPPIGQGG